MSDKVTLFGSNYSSHGDLTSNFLIKTKGKIKIQFGSKFVDLLNDKGELNADSKFIFKQDSVGSKDGIYLVGEDIILKVGNQEIKLNQTYDNIYVSFEENQKSDSEQKYNALRNIGFIYPSQSDITEDSLKNGVIYIQDEEKFYIVKNGELTEFTIQFPNPYTKQFVISKNDESIGSLLIQGEGKENSLAFPSFYLYSNNSRAYFDSQSDIYFRISDRNVMEIYKNQIKFNQKVLSDQFMSPGATSENGFRLFMNNGESILEVDNLIVRNAKDTESLFEYNQIEYYSDDNLILSYEESGNEEEDESEEESEVESIATEEEEYPYDYILTLQYKNEYQKGDKLSIFTSLSYSHSESDPDLEVNAILNCEVIDVVYEATETDEETESKATVTQEIDDKNNYIGKAKIQIKLDEESNKLISEQSKKDIFIHRKVSKQSTIYLKRDHSDLELIEEVEKVVENEETIKEYVTNSRFGDLTNLKLKSTLDNKPSTDITGYGLYSKNAAFLSAQYINGYNLPDDDNSSKFASTEWIKKRILDILKLIKSDAISIDDAKQALDALGYKYKTLYDLSSTVKDFLETVDDSDDVINKFKELEAFLNGITEKETLTGLLAENLNLAKNYTDIEIAKCVLLGKNEVPEDLNFSLVTNTSSTENVTGFNLHSGNFTSKAKSYIVNSGEIILNNGASVSDSQVGIALTKTGIKFTNLGKEFTFPSTAGVLALHSEIPTNYVTTDSDQVINGVKTFTSYVEASEYQVTNGNTGYLEVGTTRYRNGKIEDTDHILTLPGKNGTLATIDDITGTINSNIDLSAYVPINGDTEIHGTKTFTSTVYASEFDAESKSGFNVGTTNYKDHQIVYNENTFTLPNKSGTLATTDDINSSISNLSSVYVPISGNSTVNGIKTFSENLKAKSVELTNANGTYKVGNTSYKTGAIQYLSNIYSFPDSSGKLALLSDIKTQDFALTIDKGYENTEIIKNNDTIDLSNLYNGYNKLPRILTILNISTFGSVSIGSIVNELTQTDFTITIQTKHDYELEDRDLITIQNSIYNVKVVGATAFINELQKADKDNQIDAKSNSWRGQTARSQGISFRIGIDTNRISIQGIRSDDHNNDSIVYESPYYAGIGRYTVIVYGYLENKS